MVSRLGRPAWVVIALAAVLAGCEHADLPVPAACALSAGALERALAAAPGPVRLADRTPISVCVADARTDVELQQVGGVLSAAADQLAVRALTSPPAALALGYLVGATRRGAARTNGVAGQLQQRIEMAAALRDAGPASLAALHRGIVAGQGSG